MLYDKVKPDESRLSSGGGRVTCIPFLALMFGMHWLNHSLHL